jgi:glycosyltransferase involved in cell wall biosynthesis
MKICFLSLDAYPVLAGKDLGYAGGAEVEQVNLARELTICGYDVAFVIYRCGLKPTENIDGIEMIETYARETASETNVVLKSLSILSSLKKASADIYFHEAGAYGVLPLFCRGLGRKFVHRIASDAVVLSKSLNGQRSLSDNITRAYELNEAHVVIAQSLFQKRILKQRFGVDSIVIKNGMILPEVVSEKPMPPIVLWVGSISKVKAPELFVGLAKSLPKVKFEMIGGKGNPPHLFGKIASETHGVKNLRFHGFVPYHKINEYFERASIFVNTSSIEGFPNTFVQAWAHHAPVVSLSVDPDCIIQKEKLGFRSGGFEQMVSDVDLLLNDPKLRKTMADNGRKFVEREHDIRKVVKN